MRSIALHPYEIVYGFFPDTAEETSRVLTVLMTACTPARLEGAGRERRIVIPAPHQLIDSPVLVGLMQIAAARTPSDRQAARRVASQAIERGYLVQGKGVVSLRAVLTAAARSAAAAEVQSEGLAIRLGRFKPAHQNLILSEVYACLRPAEAPEFWWKWEGSPGAYAAAGYKPHRLFLAKDSKGLAAMADEMGAEPRLRRLNDLPITLGEEYNSAPKMAEETIIKLIEGLGKGALEAAGERMRFYGPAAISRKALELRRFSLIGKQLITELEARRADFMHAAEADTVIALAELRSWGLDPEFRQRYGSRADWLVPIVLAMAYESLRRPEEPEMRFLDNFRQTNRLQIGWAKAQDRSLAELDAQVDKWQRLTGSTQPRLLLPWVFE